MSVRHTPVMGAVERYGEIADPDPFQCVGISDGLVTGGDVPVDLHEATAIVGSARVLDRASRFALTTMIRREARLDADSVVAQQREVFRNADDEVMDTARRPATARIGDDGNRLAHRIRRGNLASRST